MSADAFWLLLFSVHLIAFLSVYLKKKQRRHLLVCAVFLALITLYMLKLIGFDTAVFGLGLQQGVRYLAWLLAAASLSLMLKRWIWN
jgi:hypothetical protein